MNNGDIILQTGKYHTLTLGGSRAQYRILSKGGTEVLLPAYEMPDDLKTGDKIKVFVFQDGREGLKATILKAKAELGDFAALTVRSVTDFGVFLDWGIKKDLFVPKKLLRTELEEGDTAVVCLIPDFDGIGVIGSCKIDDYFEEDVAGLKERSEAELLVFGVSELGYRVVVNNKYKGLLYKNEVYETLKIGDSRKGYIKKIREDGLIDAVLQAPGFKKASDDASSVIMDALEQSGGFLKLHDKSSPDEIKARLQMSKKLFKKTIGVLYKEKKITIEEKGIRKL